MDFFWPASFLLFVFLLSHQTLLISGLGAVGVNYGLNGDDLPAPADVIDLYGRCGINIVRIFEPIHGVLDALKGKNLVLWLGTRNEDIQGFATNQVAANAWVNDHVVPYYQSVNIAYITVGNEVVPGDAAAAPFVANAIKNIMQALVIAGVKSDIKVTTVVAMAAMEVSYPPSAGAFSAAAIGPLKDITQVLEASGAPLLLNAYPYFAYASNPQQISLDYALFTSTSAVVVDGSLQYFNLFDAMVDSFYSALEKIGATEVRIDISETGWPSKGNDPFTSIDNASTYNKNFVKHVTSGAGTPKRPNVQYDGVVFAMFNENLKAPGVEQNFGLFYPNMSPVYPFLNC